MILQVNYDQNTLIMKFKVLKKMQIALCPECHGEGECMYYNETEDLNETRTCELCFGDRVMMETTITEHTRCQKKQEAGSACTYTEPRAPKKWNNANEAATSTTLTDGLCFQESSENRTHFASDANKPEE